jgi:hypothetical protein
MSNNADTDDGKVPGDILDLEFRGGDTDEIISNIFDPRPPNTRSGNEWVRIKAASEIRRRQ